MISFLRAVKLRCSLNRYNRKSVFWQTLHTPNSFRVVYPFIGYVPLDFKHRNSGVLVSFGVSPFMRVMLNTVLSAVGRVNANAVIVNTLEDALGVIESHRVARR